ncbi:hypothetical protein V497_03242 [Pseudogymnoascus sp. VKM F-4516 (FW-969)]|nr:hypothetical protein V497_03242 [Pseudogymnoascus sp. VKM F-4516 (FW-969)]
MSAGWFAYAVLAERDDGSADSTIATVREAVPTHGYEVLILRFRHTPCWATLAIFRLESCSMRDMFFHEDGVSSISPFRAVYRHLLGA